MFHLYLDVRLQRTFVRVRSHQTVDFGFTIFKKEERKEYGA